MKRLLNSIFGRKNDSDSNSDKTSPAERRIAQFETLEARVMYSAAPVDLPEPDPAPTEDSQPQAVVNTSEGYWSSIDDFTTDLPAEGGSEINVGRDATLLDLGETTTQLNQETLETIAEAAAELWRATGLTAEQSAALDNIHYAIGDLGGNRLGSANGIQIMLDDDGAGNRWFIDLTPDQNEEFASENSTLMKALNGDSANYGIDLLTVVLHEQGHVLGLGDTFENAAPSETHSEDVMFGLFSAGEWRLPEQGAAEGFSPGSLEDTGFAVSSISLGTFSNPKQLDFNSAPVGNISGTASVFTDFGISQVSGSFSSFGDGFGVRANSSRALWANSGGLAIVDPGASGNADNVSYTFDFAQNQTRFGFGIHDQRNFTITAIFFSGGTTVGTFNISATSDLELQGPAEYFMESTIPFDRITLTDNTSGGWAIDNITLDEDTTKPTIALTGSPGSEDDGANNRFTWAASDNVALAAVSSTLTRNGSTVNSSTASSGTFDFNTLGLGTYVISTTATDTSGNTATATTSVIVTDDDTAPPVITLGGSSTTSTTDQSQNFTWGVSDPSGVSSNAVTITKDGNVIHTSSALSGSYDFSNLGFGEYQINVAATDGDNDWVGDTLSTTNLRTVTVKSVSLDGGDLVIRDANGLNTNDKITIKVDGTNYRITDPTQGLDETVAIASVTGEILVNTVGGSDTLTVDFSGGDFSDNITFNGGAGGTDDLVLQGGSFTNTTYNYTNLNDGDIDLDGLSITYTGLEPITSTVSAANVILNYGAASETITIGDAGGGQTTVTSTAAETTTFTNPTVSLTINGGGGTDSVVIDDDLDLGAANISIGEASGDVEAISFQGGLTTTGSVGLEAVNAITDNNAGDDVTAASLIAVAGAGVGSATNLLDTAVDKLEADGGTGGIFVSNTGDLEIGSVDATLTGLDTDNAHIDVRATGSIVLGEVVDAGSGDVNLAAAGIGTLTVNTPLGIAVKGDHVSLSAAGDIGSATPGEEISLEANTLSTDSSGNNGDQFLSEDDSVEVTSMNAGTGTVTMLAGEFDLTTDAVGAGTALEVEDGTTLDVNGAANTVSFAGVTINDGATLTGEGDLGENTSVTVESGGLTTPGVGGADNPGQVVTGDLTLDAGSDFVVELDGTAGAGSPGGHDQIVVIGTVTLNNATLSLGDLPVTYLPAAGEKLVIIENDGTDAVVGTFLGVPEATYVSIPVAGLPNQLFKVSYKGTNGLGNDVVLEATGETATSNVWIDGSGNLVIDDIDADTDDEITVSRSGGVFIIEDTAGNVLGTLIEGATQTSLTRIEVPEALISGVVANTKAGNDVFTIGNLGALDGELTVNDGAGFDNVVYTGTDTVLADGNSVTFNAEEIDFGIGSDLTTIDGDITATATGGIAEGGGNYQGVHLFGADLTAGGDGNITLAGEGGDTGNSNHGVHLTNGSTITTNNGNIDVDGIGGTSGASSSSKGVMIHVGSSVIADGDGAITIDGAAGNGTLQNDGVFILGATVSSFDGGMTISGTGAGSSGGDGVSITNTDLNGTGSGDIVITGTTTAGGIGNQGITFLSTNIDTTVGSGSVKLTGTGSINGTSNNTGVNLVNGSILTGGNGGIDIDGLGGGTGAGTGNRGVSLGGGIIISAAGTGEVTIDGLAGSGTLFNDGVAILGATTSVKSVDGSIMITGTGNGTLLFNRGINLTGAVESSGSGDVTLAGTGSLASASVFNQGIYISWGRVEALGGDLFMSAMGGTGSSLNAGIYILNSTINGGINSLIEGLGGGSSSLGNYGVYMQGITTSTLDETYVLAAAGGSTAPDFVGNFFP